MISKMIALDWRAMKCYQIRVLLLPIFAFGVGCVYSPIVVIPCIVLMCLSFSVNPFAVEEKGALNNLYLTLPVKRNSIVTGRYALSLLMLVCGILLGIPLMSLANLFSLSKWYVGVKGLIVLISLSYLLYTFFNLFMFPILFRLGYHKGKFWGFYLPCLVFAVLFGTYYTITLLPGYGTLTINFIQYASDNILLISGGMIVLATLLLYLSYVASIQLYAKRDL